MTSNRFYLPISTTSLPHYWGSGLIMPPGLFGTTIEKTQTIPNALILVKSLFSHNENCSLELVLMQEEIDQLVELRQETYVLRTCLPITRVANIFFRTEEQLKTTVWNINRGAAFVPKRLLKVADAKETRHRLPDIKLEFSEKEEPYELVEKVNRFNVILGGLSFMRLAYDGNYKYAENFFATLGHFNAGIANRVAWYRDNKHIEFNYRYIDLFTVKESEWSKWRNYIYRGINASHVEELANREGIPVVKSLSGFKMDRLSPDTLFYDMVLLAIYGENKQKSLEDLVSFLFASDLGQPKIEEIALLFGLQTGYKNLRNTYKVKGNQLDVKLRFESQLDYTIVESIFEFVFYGKNFITSFSHLEPILPKEIVQSAGLSEDQFLILDTVGTSKAILRNSVIVDATLTDLFFEDIARAIYKWGVPYDTDQRMLQRATEFLKDRFGNQLKVLLNSADVKAPSQVGSQDKSDQGEALKTSKEGRGKLDLNFSGYTLAIADYENYSWTELKKLAAKKGITIPKTMKGTLKDFLTLVEKIESINTIAYK